MFRTFTLLSIGVLSGIVYDMNKKLEKYSKVVGNIKIDDLDEDFWK